jgi:hypothetical protein
METSPITEQMEWESVEKGSPLWVERQNFFWKTEIKRMFMGWTFHLDDGADARREWQLRHLDIPF